MLDVQTIGWYAVRYSKYNNNGGMFYIVDELREDYSHVEMCILTNGGKSWIDLIQKGPRDVTLIPKNWIGCSAR